MSQLYFPLAPDFNTLTTLTSATITGTSLVIMAYHGLTSTSINTISSSTRFTLDTNLSNAQTDVSTGTYVTVSSTADPTNFIKGSVIQFVGNRMLVDTHQIGGSGTYSSWNIVGGVAYQLGVQDLINLLNIPQTLFDLDGGAPDSNYGGITPLDAGTIQ